MRKKIEADTKVINNPTIINWCKRIPIKVTTFTWRSLLNRIPSAIALTNRGINIDTFDCSSCIDGIEDANHILVSCPFAKTVTNYALRWCGITNLQVQNIDELLNFTMNWNSNQKKNDRLTVICYGLPWSLWRAHNDRLFKARFTNPTKVVESIKSLVLVFMWLKYRAKMLYVLGKVFVLPPFLFKTIYFVTPTSLLASCFLG